MSAIGSTSKKFERCSFQRSRQTVNSNQFYPFRSFSLHMSSSSLILHPPQPPSFLLLSCLRFPHFSTPFTAPRLLPVQLPPNLLFPSRFQAPACASQRSWTRHVPNSSMPPAPLQKVKVLLGGNAVLAVHYKSSVFSQALPCLIDTTAAWTLRSLRGQIPKASSRGKSFHQRVPSATCSYRWGTWEPYAMPTVPTTSCFQVNSLLKST